MTLGRAIWNRKCDTRLDYHQSRKFQTILLVHVKRHKRDPHRATAEIVISLLAEENNTSRETDSENRLTVRRAGPVKVPNYIIRGECLAIFFVYTKSRDSGVPDSQLVAHFVHFQSARRVNNPTHGHFSLRRPMNQGGVRDIGLYSGQIQPCKSA